MTHGIPKLHTFPIYRADLGTYYCEMYSGHGNIQGIRGVRKQLQQEEQNMRQPSPMALTSSTVIDQVLYSNALLLFARTVCCSFCCTRVGYALIPKSK